MKPASLSYARPATLSDAVNNLQSLTDECRVIAGGQSLGPMLNLRLAQPKHLVDISRLTDLHGAKVQGLLNGRRGKRALLNCGEQLQARHGLSNARRDDSVPIFMTNRTCHSLLPRDLAVGFALYPDDRSI